MKPSSSKAEQKEGQDLSPSFELKTTIATPISPKSKSLMTNYVKLKKSEKPKTLKDARKMRADKHPVACLKKVVTAPKRDSMFIAQRKALIKKRKLRQYRELVELTKRLLILKAELKKVWAQVQVQHRQLERLQQQLNDLQGLARPAAAG